MKDPYVYEGTNVLKNKKNYRNLDDLEIFETATSTLRIFEILNNHPNAIDLYYIFEIHHRLFCDVYDWAGLPRKINIYKNEPIINGLSVDYADFKTINKSIEKLNNSFKNEKWNEMKKKEILRKICFYSASIWKIHSFREGNTRTVFVLLVLLVKQFNLKFNEEIISKNAKYFRNSLVLASLGDYADFQYLEKIIGDSISIKVKTKTGLAYKTINGYNVEKYNYSLHKAK